MDNCQDCGNPYPLLQKAHIIAKHKGGTDDPSNIIRICPNCHQLRDHADRVAWSKKRWESVPPEERSETIRRQMAALSPEQKEARGRRISQSKTGQKNRPSTKPRGPKVWTQEQIDRRSAAVKAAWAKKSPEEREAWKARCRETKAKKAVA